MLPCHEKPVMSNSISPIVHHKLETVPASLDELAMAKLKQEVFFYILWYFEKKALCELFITFTQIKNQSQTLNEMQTSLHHLCTVVCHDFVNSTGPMSMIQPITYHQRRKPLSFNQSPVTM